MKKIYSFAYTLSILLFLSGCPDDYHEFSETRTERASTVLLGISGEHSNEPYVEILYSVADENKPGFNKTVREMVSPPYLFQNNNVIMKYEYIEEGRNGSISYHKFLVRDFEEGGAEYLRIINHSDDKNIEFFLGGPLIPSVSNPSEVSLSDPSKLLLNGIPIPVIWHKKAPIDFLLQPEKKPSQNVYIFPVGYIVFEGNRIGDLTVTEAWSVEDIATLYRKELARDGQIYLTCGDWRLADWVDDKKYAPKLYGVIKPGEELHGKESIRILSISIGQENWLGSGRL